MSKHSQHKELKGFVEMYLLSQHPFRKGAVCPFMEEVLVKDGLYYILEDCSTTLQIEDHVISFLQRVALSEQKYRACILQLDATMCLSEAKNLVRTLRLKVAKEGWMIGAFGPEDDTPSLHNEDFYPFRSPTNIVVLREMTNHDFQFFAAANFSTRVALYNGFLLRFNGDSTTSTKINVEKAKNYLSKWYVKLLTKWQSHM